MDCVLYIAGLSPFNFTLILSWL